MAPALQTALYLTVFLCCAQLVVVLLLARNSLRGNTSRSVERVDDLVAAIFARGGVDNNNPPRMLLASQRKVRGLRQTCEPIHVALVVGGHKATRAAVILIKSVLFFRKNPLHLHLVVDEMAHEVLDTLFATWRLPGVETSYYAIEDLVPKVSWIRTIHYSGRFGLVKLALPEVLPQSLERVIVLDTDVTLNADIAGLWRIFDTFSATQVIGLVENQSNWYLYKDSHWPALGRGFNTGVSLLHLSRLRIIGWHQLWNTTAIEYLAIKNVTQLADQDVVNAVIKKLPELVHRVPCEWNVQLSLRTRSKNCYGHGDEPKLVHWNSFRKEVGLQNEHRDFFRKMYLSFADYDGSLLRKEVLGCVKPPPDIRQSPISGFAECRELMNAASATYRVHLYYLRLRLAENQDEQGRLGVTMVTQLTPDRLPMLDMIAAVWPGPMSVAVYASDAEARDLIDFVTSSKSLNQRLNVGYHVVYKEGTQTSPFYPVNYLRNVAMNHVTTSHVFLNDVDFVPRPGLHAYLVNVLTRNLYDNHTALVVGAFETHEHRLDVPATKKGLLLAWDRHLVNPFRYAVWKMGHSPLNYTRWKTATEPYKVEWQPYFEPYVVVPRSAPRYDKRFVGFGWNKVAHVMELHAVGFKFVVLPEAFVVHFAHAPSVANTRFRLDAKYRKCISEVKSQFVRDLQRQFPNMNFTSLND